MKTSTINTSKFLRNLQNVTRVMAILMGTLFAIEYNHSFIEYGMELHDVMLPLTFIIGAWLVISILPKGTILFRILAFVPIMSAMFSAFFVSGFILYFYIEDIVRQWGSSYSLMEVGFCFLVLGTLLAMSFTDILRITKWHENGGMTPMIRGFKRITKSISTGLKSAKAEFKSENWKINLPVKN